MRDLAVGTYDLGNIGEREGEHKVRPYAEGGGRARGSPLSALLDFDDDHRDVIVALSEPGVAAHVP
jgi:hypothetical protein